MKNYFRKQLSGFTLIELMITVSVIAIGAALALPSFEDMYKRNRAATIANTMLASLAYARSEASTRGVNVRIAPTAGVAWSNGWQIHADDNNDGNYANDEMIRNYEGFNNHSTLNQNVGAGTVIFLPSGQLGPNPPVTDQFTLSANQCDPGKEYQRIINISASGMARIDNNNKTCP